VKNRPVYNESMENRLHRISENLIVPYRKKYGESNYILGKQTVKISKMSTIFSSIKHWPAEDSEPCGSRYTFQTSNKKRFYENTGLLFIHNENKYTPDVKEWKWLELNTITFRMELDKGICRLFYKENEELHLFKEFTPRPGFLRKVKNQIDEDDFEGNIKCSYDVVEGDWVCYECHSEFKIDNRDRVFDLLEIFAQRVTKVDLLKKYDPKKKDEEVVYQTPSQTPSLSDVSPEVGEIKGEKRTHANSFEYSPEERSHSRKKYENY